VGTCRDGNTGVTCQTLETKGQHQPLKINMKTNKVSKPWKIEYI
jgi:hypothetical protein